jgi:hypothetical protein
MNAVLHAWLRVKVKGKIVFVLATKMFVWSGGVDQLTLKLGTR